MGKHFIAMCTLVLMDTLDMAAYAGAPPNHLTHATPLARTHSRRAERRVIIIIVVVVAAAAAGSPSLEQLLKDGRLVHHLNRMRIAPSVLISDNT